MIWKKTKVIRLAPGAYVQDVKLSLCYEGKVLKNGLIALNKDVRGKLSTRKDLPEGSFVAVCVSKLLLPDSVELLLIEGDYEVIEKKEMKDIGHLSELDIGHEFVFYCRVEEVQQTSGPTLFTIFDGTGSIVAKSFSGAGKRSFPELEKGDAIKAFVEVGEREEVLECKLIRYERLPEDKERQLKVRIAKELEQRAQADDVSFMIKSEILEQLRPHIMKLASEVKKAILEDRPIILRHHADCDGYSGAVALEKAILPLIVKQHRDASYWHYYRRCPSKAPFYNYEDVSRDLTFAIQEMARFGQKEPLIIMVDNGSTEEDIPAIRKIKVYDAKMVIVDHHYPGVVKNGKTIVDSFIDAHVNPYLVGGNSSLTAGMLGTEVARFINKDIADFEFIPALAGVADRVDDSADEFIQYLEIALSKGYDKEFLKELAECIDFEAHYLKFSEGKSIVDDLMGDDFKKQKKLVALLQMDVKQKRAEGALAVLHYLKVNDSDGRVIADVEITSVTFRGEFPPVGKTTGMTHDKLVEMYQKPVFMVAHGPDFIIVRASKEFDFNLNLLVRELMQVKPHALVNGGGHELAGTIKFVEAAKPEIMDYVFKYVKNTKVKK